MSKKRSREEDVPPTKTDRNGTESSDEEDFDIVNVDFEWFNFQEADFHYVKILLRQLFDVDATLFDLSALVDLILSQTNIGSTVKCHGKDSDAYAFISALSLAVHGDKKPVKDVVTYLSEKATKQVPELSAQLSELLAPGSSARIGLLLTERLINMPIDIIPTTYTMLLDELAAAMTTNPALECSHFLILSKAYQEVASTLSQSDGGEGRRRKKPREEACLYHFHPEDELLQKHALAHGSFAYTKEGDAAVADSKRAFQEMGIQTKGYVLLVEARKLPEAIEAIRTAVKQ